LAEKEKARNFFILTPYLFKV